MRTSLGPTADGWSLVDRTGSVPLLAWSQMAPAAPRVTVGFDDVDLGGRPYDRLPDQYDGFHWKHIWAEDSTLEQEQSGYVTGVTSGTQAAFNIGAVPGYVSIYRGSFTLESVNLTAAWDSRLTVDIYGYRHGAEVYHRTVDLNDLGPTAVRLDFAGVDKVGFVPGAETDDPALDGQGPFIVFDDFAFAKIKGGLASAEPGLLGASYAGHHLASLAHLHSPTAVDAAGMHPLA